MKILHISAHLGGGVGKALSSLCRLDGAEIQRHFVLLEEPRDTRHADTIRQSGATISIAPDHARLSRLAAEADIVQIEWWNHPRLYECLCRSNLPPARTVIWSHISGLFAPHVPMDLLSSPHKFLFTSRCSLENREVQALFGTDADRLGVINSGYGFGDGAAAWQEEDAERSASVGYLGTAHFSKLSPLLFDVVDRAHLPRPVSVWGEVDRDGDVARRAAAMRDPGKILFHGHASDPEAVFRKMGIFLYLLQPRHFGTAENALIEAMSFGCVPLVLDNPAERAIVDHGHTGFVETGVDAVADRLDWMLRHPDAVREMGRNASLAMATTRSAQQAWADFAEVYRSILSAEKRPVDYAAILGATPADWFLSTQDRPFVPADDEAADARKGSLAHFTSCFPDDLSLRSLFPCA